MTLSKAIDRRTFLRGVDASTAVLPFVPAQLTSAAEMAAPRRVVFWWTAQGIFHPEFTPDGADSAFTLRRVLAPLAKYKDLLLLPKRLDCNAYFAKPINNDHEPAAYTLTGAEVETNGSGSTFALGPSIDQYLAQRLGRQGSQDRLIWGCSRTGRRCARCSGARRASPSPARTTLRPRSTASSVPRRRRAGPIPRRPCAPIARV